MLRTSRADIAAALEAAGIDGLAASTSVPDTVVPGCAWPVWTTTNVLTGCVTENEWEVWVVLPPGHEDAALDVLDDVRDPLTEALRKVGAVTVLRPSQYLPGDANGNLPALVIELTTN